MGVINLDINEIELLANKIVRKYKMKAKVYSYGEGKEKIMIELQSPEKIKDWKDWEKIKEATNELQGKFPKVRIVLKVS